MTRTQVDATTKNQDVELTMHVTDGLMGVDQAASGCSVMHEASRMVSGRGNFSRVSGDAIDGIYKCTITILAQAAPGRWGLDIDTWDLVRNRSEFLQASFGIRFFGDPIVDANKEYWITNVGKGDAFSPRITQPKISVTSVDASKADQPLKVTMTVTDDYSGVAGLDCSVGYKQIEFLDGKYGAGSGKLISGNKLKGTWECSMILPKQAGTGKWTLSIGAWDKTGKNYRIS